MKPTVVVFIIVVFFTCCGNFPMLWAAPMTVSQENAYYCGKVLEAAMAQVCNHRYHNPSGYSIRYKRQIADECCDRPCNLEQMKQYCSEN